jgi:cation diffusion facilitator CzcD-associated flavoprotein CzcO
MPQNSKDSDARRPRVLVLGGGFGGVGAAAKLKGADVDVVVVDRPRSSRCWEGGR